MKSIKEIFTTTPLKLSADHDVINRIEEQVAKRIVAAAKRAGCLTIRIVHNQGGVPESTAETFAPVVIEKRNHAPHRQGDTLDRSTRISKWSYLDTNINRRIVHVVLDSLAVYKRQPRRVVL